MSNLLKKDFFSKDGLFNITVTLDNGEILFDVETVAKSLGLVGVSTKSGGRKYEWIRWDRVNEYLKISPQVGKGDFIPEPAVYKLAFKASNEIAEKFQDWLAVEVLPSIRKHGSYMTENVLDEVINNPDFGIKLLTELKKEKEEKKKLELKNKQKDQLIGELKPKADYTDRILKNKGLVTTTQIAKDYGMSAQEMNKLLHDLKVQYKQSGQWLLYSRYHSKGYTHSETIDIVRSDGTPDITMNTKWTQKGRLFLYNLLKSKNVLPIIEQTAESEIAVGREI
ncbi:phage antirepressor protein [Clostridium botulinum B2 267]|uniref:Phage antirepressor protein n=1 Tax=Clostridium botulinum TaxID=1491 RepID=A0A6G4D0A0_CLOBO|nr:phage antirepressor KilAC domain-containing protein [Clostridium botulinum]KEI87587.1 phage antirepressor protein [Clostridium botulinum B2 267]NFC47399.1 phage antirepressor protein [Clostridium botulinum]